MEPLDGYSPTDQVEFHDINDLIDEWHDAPEDGRSLHKFLGMSFKDYGRWAMGEMTAEELATFGYYEE